MKGKEKSLLIYLTPLLAEQPPGNALAHLRAKPFFMEFAHWITLN